MIEAVIAVALIAICAGAALAAVAAVTHAQAHTIPSAVLTASAQNVLTDLRAATAYDADELATLAGRTAAFDANEPAANGPDRTVHIVVSVAHAVGTDEYVGSVTARGADGTSVTLSSTLVQEAPAPGSTVPASAPLKQTTSATAADTAADSIAL